MYAGLGIVCYNTYTLLKHIWMEIINLNNKIRHIIHWILLGVTLFTEQISQFLGGKVIAYVSPAV